MSPFRSKLLFIYSRSNRLGVFLVDILKTSRLFIVARNMLRKISNPKKRTDPDFKSGQFVQVGGDTEDWNILQGIKNYKM